MSNGKKLELTKLSCQLQTIASAVYDTAQDCQGNAKALLALLRQLEQLHREIRDGAFQQSLPDNRQGLYSLLRDIEAEGGWPYIERMRLQAFLTKAEQQTAVENSSEVLENDSSLNW
ncbi:hypothetical protein [Brasilonema bromeliae]|uniref:Uncharacterized protein n=1 Tax=Brasilonema bromeliae SPC951 TaxID=385972 RepID=A0ABX1P7I4_9CYAN|nr:hypothetical protein [Brasilonema bromeliae]KAB8335070.1 hypothetical protein SD80_001515 [Scytonema tolypothrichoides VB-61278]NMG19901.1 hypothetical protein [Brasilonema bromeliae SPC951]